MPILVLPPDVAAQIAAGEVIERPASAVKELVENALDAGASAVTVEIERGGLDLIRVADDGCGMTGAELALAIQRHATSKLRTADDLRGVLTLGFRGEGLPSMAAAADLEIRTRPAGEESGAVLTVREGVPGPVRPAGGPPGTSATLRGLFSRQPARRAFLRTTSGETAAVAGLISTLALAYPGVRFSLSVDGRRTLETSGSGDLREAAARVHGAGVAGRLLTVGGHDGDPSINVSGLVGPPEVARASRSAIALFVNGRPVQSRRLVYAIESAYETLLHGGRHPVAIIDVRLPPEELDVNVHPAKAEVRFRAERAVFAAVQSAVRRAVLGGSPVPHLGSVPAPSAEPESASEEPPPARTLWPEADLAGNTAATPASEPPRPAMPLLRVIGQMGTTYIIAEGPDGMYLIDQHAAHERVLYERILGERAGRGVEVQSLLSPETFDITSAQTAVFGAAAADLAALGFDVEPFGEGTLAVRAVPAVLAGRDVARAVREFLDALAAPEAGDGVKAERAPMTLACHAAVRAGMTLGLEEMRDLARQLEGCASPRTCPHGRPTMMHLSATALDREFRRR